MTIARCFATRLSSLAFQAAALVAMTLWPLPSAFGQNVTTSQTAEPPVTSQPADVTEKIASEITAETIQARIAQVGSGSELPEVTRTEVLGLYEKAQEQINLAESWAKQTAEYEQGRQQAPALLAKLKQAQEQAATQPAKELMVPVPPDAQVKTMADDKLEELIGQADTELKKCQDKAKKLADASKQLNDEAKTRLQRKELIPDLLSDAKKRIEKITSDLSAPSASGIAPQLAQARRTLLLAQKRAVEQEIKTYEEELRFYDARSDLLAARRDDAKRKADEAQTLMNQHEAVVSNLRKRLLDRQRIQAKEELPTKAPDAIQALAKENAKLISDRKDIDDEIGTLKIRAETVKDLTATLAKRFESLQKNIDQEFRKAGIEIAFPQRDIHLRSIQAALPVIGQDVNKS